MAMIGKSCWNFLIIEIVCHSVLLFEVDVQLFLCSHSHFLFISLFVLDLASVSNIFYNSIFKKKKRKTCSIVKWTISMEQKIERNTESRKGNKFRSKKHMK